MDSDEATAWLTEQENRTKFGGKIGPSAIFRTRVHNLIAFHVPLGITPEDQRHRQEVCEANSLDSEIITTMRWAKPVHRRAKEQRTAHLILTFNSAAAANRATLEGASPKSDSKRNKMDTTISQTHQDFNRSQR